MADILASASTGVPKCFAVLGINWISPVAPLPTAFFMDGLKVSPVSNAMQAVKKSGFTFKLPAIFMAFSLNAFDTLAPHAISEATFLLGAETSTL